MHRTLLSAVAVALLFLAPGDLRAQDDANPCANPCASTDAPAAEPGPATDPAPAASGEFEPEDLGTFKILGGRKLHKLRFPNGLKVLVVEDDSAPVFNYATWYHVGSSDEVEGKTGIAHLFEHMMFKQTEDLEEGEFDRTIEEAGSPDLNAWTWLDQTVYPESLPSDKLDLVARLEASRMQRLVIDAEALESEREVVINERRFRTDNNPFGKMNEVLWNTAFTKHQYGWPTVGWQKDLEGITVEDCLSFYRQYYAPNNATIIVAGDVTRDQVVEVIKKYYSGYEAAQIQRPAKPPEPEQLEPRRVKLYLPVETDQVLMGYKSNNYAHVDYAYLNLAAIILGGGESSRFERFLRKEGIVSDYSSWVAPLEHPGLFEVSLSMRDGHPAEEGEAYVQAIIDSLAADGPAEWELEMAKAQMEKQELSQLEEVRGVAEWVGFNEVIGGDHRVGIDLFNFGREATAEQVQQAVAKYLTSSRRTTVVAFPIDSPANIGRQPTLQSFARQKDWKARFGKGVKAIEFEGNEDLFVNQEHFVNADADGDGLVKRKEYEHWRGRERIRQVRQAQQVEKYELERSSYDARPMPNFMDLTAEPPEPSRTLGKAVREKDVVLETRMIEDLDGGEPAMGGNLIIVPDRAIGLTHFRLHFTRGASQDPEGKEGLAYLAANMVTRGTASYSRDEFNAVLEQIGGSFNVDVDHDGVTFYGSVLFKNWPVFLALIEEALISPALSNDEFKALKDETLASIMDARNSDRSLARTFFRKELMAGTGYAHDVWGDAETVKKVKLKDVRDWLDSMLISAEAVAGASGRMDNMMADDLKLLLGAFDKDEIPPRKEVGTPAPLDGRRVLFVDKPERTQTQIVIGQPGIAFGDPDFSRLWVANHVFGGGSFSARLMVEVRVKRGWSYGASARYDRNKHGGSYFMWIFPASQYAADAAELVLGLADAYAADGVTDDELAFASGSLSNMAAFYTASAGDKLSYEFSKLLTGEDRLEIVNSLTGLPLAEVNATVANRFNPDNLLITVVGTASELKDKFAALPGVTEVKVVSYTGEPMEGADANPCAPANPCANPCAPAEENPCAPAEENPCANP